MLLLIYFEKKDSQLSNFLYSSYTMLLHVRVNSLMLNLALYMHFQYTKMPIIKKEKLFWLILYMTVQFYAFSQLYTDIIGILRIQWGFF